jgi:hypothetical protein
MPTHRRSTAVIGLAPPRLSRKEEWGHWRISIDRKTLVCVAERAGYYQVTLAELPTAEACVARMQQVIAEKSAWVDQRILDDLRRALIEIKRITLPKVSVESR